MSIPGDGVMATDSVRRIRTQLGGSTFGQRREDIFRRFQESAHQLSNNFRGKELVTEQNDSAQELCDSLEELLGYGLRQSTNGTTFSAASFIQNMHEIVSGNSSITCNNNETTFWDFCQSHLTPHERQRYLDLKQIWTNVGRGRAFVRASLNEKRLYSHVLTWLSDEEQLHKFYTPWSLLLNEEVAKQLPKIIDSLKDVFFSLNVDTTDLNAPRRSARAVVLKEEPVIYAPNPVPVVARHKNRPVVAIERHIEEPSSPLDLLGDLRPIDSIQFPQLLSKDVLDEQPNNPLHHRFDSSEPAEPIDQNEEIHVAGETELYEDHSDTSSQWSKSSSPNWQTNNRQEQTDLEEQVNVLSERCALLETRVADLSLQNRLLIRRLTKQFEMTGIDPSSSLTSNFLITIPQVKLEKGQRSRSHYAYEIHITMRERLDHWTLYRRYSEFDKLHKSLLRTHPVVNSVEFPPKKHFGNMNLVFVEERRQQLQIYLLNIVELLPQVEACKSKAELQKAFAFFRER